MNLKMPVSRPLSAILEIEISNKLLCTGTIQGRYYYADKLGLAFEEPIYGSHRIRQGNKEPLAIEYTYVPLKFFPDIDNYNFEQISLYDYMSTRDHLPVCFPGISDYGRSRG